MSGNESRDLAADWLAGALASARGRMKSDGRGDISDRQLLDSQPGLILGLAQLRGMQHVVNQVTARLDLLEAAMGGLRAQVLARIDSLGASPAAARGDLSAGATGPATVPNSSSGAVPPEVVAALIRAHRERVGPNRLRLVSEAPLEFRSMTGDRLPAGRGPGSGRPYQARPGDEAGKGRALPDCRFRIGEGDAAEVGQLPDLASLVRFSAGRGARVLPGNQVDAFCMAPVALGTLLGDAVLKLVRPWALSSGARHAADPAQTIIGDVFERLAGMGNASWWTRMAYFCRIGEFLEVVLHQPDQVPGIVANLDAMTNARLEARCRAVMDTGEDPGIGDLWPAVPIDGQGTNAAAEGRSGDA